MFDEILFGMTYQSGQALEELSAFVAVVEANGYTAAARKFNVRKATLSENVQSLERRLGVALLVRTTRSLRLTNEGSAYLEHAQRAMAAAHEADAAVAMARAMPMGILRVTTPPGFDAVLLTNVIIPYLAQNPDVVVEIDGSAHKRDLVRDGFDVALRSGMLEDSSLVSRRLGTLGTGYFGSPRYLARAGTPKRPEDLPRHTTISLAGSPATKEWTFIDGSKRKKIVLRPRLVLNTFELVAEAAVAGIGIAWSTRYAVQPLVAKKRLTEVLREWPAPPMVVHAIFPRRGALVPRTRIFVDAVARWFDASNGEI